MRTPLITQNDLPILTHLQAIQKDVRAALVHESERPQANQQGIPGIPMNVHELRSGITPSKENAYDFVDSYPVKRVPLNYMRVNEYRGGHKLKERQAMANAIMRPRWN